jgi:hypothetical protein
MRRLLKPLWVLLALVFLFEAWLWTHLAPVVAWIVALAPWQALKDRFALLVERLSPTATLGVFVIPVILLLPIKFLGLWLLARGSWLGAMATLALAKVVSLGVTAFIFDVTRPKLLQIAWFRRLYDRVLIWLAWAHAQVDPIKARLRAWLHEAVAPFARHLGQKLRLVRPGMAGGFLRRVSRFRRRVQRGEPAE